MIRALDAPGLCELQEILSGGLGSASRFAYCFGRHSSRSSFCGQHFPILSATRKTNFSTSGVYGRPEKNQRSQGSNNLVKLNSKAKKIMNDIIFCPIFRYPEARALNRKIIFHAGPTNSGKTFQALQKFLDAKSGVYCGPLKLLAVEVFNKSNEKVWIK